MKLTRDGALTAILVIAALFVGSVVSGLFPSAADVLRRPYLHASTLGEPVELRNGTVNVTGVATAREVQAGAVVATTSQVWTVVDVTFLARDEPVQFPVESIRLRATNGRHYGGQLISGGPCGLGQPGIEQGCQFAYEMPVEALEGAVLLVPASATLSGPDDVAEFDLGIDAERAAELAEPAQRIELHDPTEAVQ